MRSIRRLSLHRITGWLLGVLLLGAVGLAGCAAVSPSGEASGSGAARGARASSETTPGQFPADAPGPAQAPAPPTLTSPQATVYSYLTWISYAYRQLDSSVATMTFSTTEEVRVNSYVELNREKGRAIDQRLVDSRITSVVSTGDTATVGVRESWVYRYIDTSTGQYSSPILKASYDSTYTVIKGRSGWLVDSVEVAPLGGPVK